MFQSTSKRERAGGGGGGDGVEYRKHVVFEATAQNEVYRTPVSHTCESLAMLFYSEHVENDEHRCETT